MFLIYTQSPRATTASLPALLTQLNLFLKSRSESSLSTFNRPSSYLSDSIMFSKQNPHKFRQTRSFRECFVATSIFLLLRNTQIHNMSCTDFISPSVLQPSISYSASHSFWCTYLFLRLLFGLLLSSDTISELIISSVSNHCDREVSDSAATRRDNFPTYI